MMVLYVSGVLGWILIWLTDRALISYCSFAICSNSCMSGDIVVTLLTNIGGGFGVVSMFDFWWCSELSSSERAE
jgi:hypothetical protein